MTMVQDIFKARADSFGETMIGGSGTVSFKLPDYQRPYDWDKRNVERLLQDCLNGLKGTASDSPGHPYTFLGTIILTSDESKEATFDGESLLILDGQQRLTTLLLLSCALFVAIRNHRHDINALSDIKVRKWLDDEIGEQLNRLYGCTTGQRQSLSPTTPFPRMVRVNDNRGHREGHSEYRSLVAVFLSQFGKYCTSQVSDFLPAVDESDSHLLEMYEHLADRIEEFVYLGQSAPEDDDFSPPVLTRNEFALHGCRNLFVKLIDMGQQSDVTDTAAKVASSPETEGLVRLLLFASYLMRSVVLTVVEAPNEDIGFDVFDALNTTGEPLTALETLKPHIARFERTYGDDCSRADSEYWWSVLEENVMEPHDSPTQRQLETKELVTGFALLYAGEKIGSDLNVQRNALRNYFIRRVERRDHETAREIVRSLGRMALYRRQFWDKEGIEKLVGQQLDSGDYDSLKLCLSLIADTNTSTTVPILARYWIEFGEMDSERHFLSAVEAVTAFLILRRSMTGGTVGIDSDFRKIMSPDVGSGGNPLCLGLGMTNRILDIDELKSGLCALLAVRRFRVTDKETWLNRAREVPFGDEAPRALSRFLLFAAAHNARADSGHPGLLTSEGVIESDELRFLSYPMWLGQRYATVEHVAPDAEASSGWDTSIYERLSTRHTIGNLVLLPEPENQSIGNAPWDKKKLFYRALVAKTEEEREDAISRALQQGLRFGNRTLSLIRSQSRLYMLDPLAEVNEWTAELIEARTENVLSLAWDNIAPWLFE